MIVWLTFGRSRRRSNRGNENCGVGGREDRANEETRLQGDPEGGGRDGAGDDRGQYDARDCEEPKSECHRSQDAQREVEPTVEEDETDAESEKKLNARGVERQLDGVERVRAQGDAGGEEQHHAREAERVRGELAGEPGGERDRERLEDIVGGHSRATASSATRTDGFAWGTSERR